MKQKEPLKVLMLVVPVLLMAIGSGWVGDTIFDSIFQADYPRCTLILVGLAGFVMFLGGGYWIYKIREDYFPARILERANEIPPRKVLISMVSPPNFEFLVPPNTTGGKPRIRMKRTNEVVGLTGDIEQDTASNTAQWNWQQMLRGIKPHLPGLKRIHLIGSSGEDGSFTHLLDCSGLLAGYTEKECKITRDDDDIEFDDIDALMRRLREVIKEVRKAGYTDADIMIDVTGGLKTASIAAALVTLSNPRLHFQYVRMRDPRPLSFNVVAERQGDIS